MAIFSMIFNLSLLISPIYMLQIYDRVLTSENLTTLFLITLVAIGFVAVGSVIKHYRTQVGQRLANLLRDRFGAVIAAEVNMQAEKQDLANESLERKRKQPEHLGDLNALVDFLGSPRFGSSFDLPWTPVFMLLLYVVHPYLGIVASIFGLVLLGFGIAVHKSKAAQGNHAAIDRVAADSFLLQCFLRVDDFRALGMTETISEQWRQKRQQADVESLPQDQMSSSWEASRNFLRQTAQIITLGLGAYLVIHEVISAGMIVAGSIICSRALAPLDTAPSTWLAASAAYRAYWRLASQMPLHDGKPHEASVHREANSVHLKIEGISASKQIGNRTIKINGLSLDVAPATLIGIIGPDAAEKSLLASLIVGAAMPTTGRISLGDAEVHRMTPEGTCRHIGYIPSDVVFLDGTVGQNITRFRTPTERYLVDALECAGLYNEVAQLSKGFDTPLRDALALLGDHGAASLSVARAFYRTPSLIVVQDADRLPKAMVQLIVSNCRRNGQSLVLISDQQATIASLDLLALLANGRIDGTGPPKRVIDGLRSLNERKGLEG